MSLHLLEPKTGFDTRDTHSASDLIETLTAHHTSQMKLCTELEDLADALPEDLDGARCARAARALNPAVQHAHRFEEDDLFPWLSAKMANDNTASAALKDSLKRLRYEHLEDESFAEELADKMLDYIHNRDRLDEKERAERAELLGYMLRGFFEGVRRHIAFEQEHILPLLMRV